MSWGLRRQGSLALLLLLGACQSPLEYRERERLLAVDPIYRVWLDEVILCMGRDPARSQTAFARITWYEADGIFDPRITDRAQNIWGAWEAPHSIVLRRDKLRDEMVVKHEIVHDQLQDPSHQSPFFLECAKG